MISACPTTKDMFPKECEVSKYRYMTHMSAVEPVNIHEYCMFSFGLCHCEHTSYNGQIIRFKQR